VIELRNSCIDTDIQLENHLEDVGGTVIVTSISKKQVRKCTHSIRLMALSPEFVLSPMSMAGELPD
jgi:hypothetical protein